MPVIEYLNDGITIDHGDRDLSAAARNGLIEMGIGENYLGAEGYERWTEINLTLEEARAFRDWLTLTIGPPKVPDTTHYSRDELLGMQARLSIHGGGRTEAERQFLSAIDDELVRRDDVERPHVTYGVAC